MHEQEEISDVNVVKRHNKKKQKYIFHKIILSSESQNTYFSIHLLFILKSIVPIYGHLLYGNRGM